MIEKLLKKNLRKPMEKYKILEHISDLKIRAFGKNKKELFLNVMIGMFEGAKYEKEEEEIKREIKVSSKDLSSLLVDFLSEILYFCETNREVYHNIKFKKMTDKNIEGILIGKKLKRMGVQIKGVTYHNLDISQRKDGIWQAIILFDI